MINELKRYLKSIDRSGDWSMITYDDVGYVLKTLEKWHADEPLSEIGEFYISRLRMYVILQELAKTGDALFTYFGASITNPFVDTTGRYQVDPITHYGWSRIAPLIQNFLPETESRCVL